MKIFNQTKVTPKWGAIKLSYTQSMPYLTIWNFVMITITAYNTTIRDFFAVRGIYIEFWHFILIMIFGALFIMFLEYKFSMSSTYRFTWDQSYKHSTLLPNKLNEIENKLDAIIKKFNIEVEK